MENETWKMENPFGQYTIWKANRIYSNRVWDESSDDWVFIVWDSSPLSC